MRRLLMAALALLCAGSVYADEPGPDAGPGPPLPPPHGQYASHNGSLMLITPFPNHEIEISYVRPSPVLGDLVVPGDVVLRGQWQPDGWMNGTAYVFPPRPCPAIPYEVRGTANPDLRGQLVMKGAAPVVDPYTCHVVGHTTYSANATLVFMVQGQQ